MLQARQRPLNIRCPSDQQKEEGGRRRRRRRRKVYSKLT
jgi:hypothetical protein